MVHIIDSTRYRIPAGNSTYLKPEEVTVSHCYDLTNPQPSVSEGYLFFNIVSAMEMQVFHSTTGACPASFPAAGFKTFYR